MARQCVQWYQAQMFEEGSTFAGKMWRNNVPLRNLGASLALSVRLSAIFGKMVRRNVLDFT